MKIKQSIVILCCYINAISCHFPGDRSSEWNRKYKKPEGRYTRNVEDYEIVVPQKVNEDSSFLSYNLPHYHDIRHQHSENDVGHSAEKRDFKEHGVHYRVKIGGKDHHLELLPNWNLISPNLVLEKRGKKESDNSSQIKIRRIADEQNCHFNGAVRGQSNSFVALSLCEGLVGFIKTDEDKFFIEPLRGEEPMANGQYLHLIHKRGRGPPGLDSGTCGTSGDWEKAWKERLTRQALFRMEMQNSTTTKRAVSRHNYIETLVVADRKFLEHHKADSEMYILTIMNMVSAFFHDTSIGNQIDICIVRIVFLETEKEELDLEITGDAEKTLHSFRVWQMRMNPKRNHPNHHDVAILFTRHDICRGGNEDPCGTIGLAGVATVCDPEKSCAITEDTGLVLAVTVAHEVGHLLGCSHDDNEETPCSPESGNGYQHIMSSSGQLATDKWSKCSRQFVTELLESGIGDCLANEPADNKFQLRAEMLPGAIYDTDMQCSWYYGPNAKACYTDPDSSCQELNCKKDEKSCFYASANIPADGTPCGSKKWCFHKKCVEVGSRLEAINGGWGPWGPASECSRTCGGGVSVTERECDSPKPSTNGRYCLGQRKRYKICNTKKCPPDKPTFRELQCTEKDSIEIRGEKHTWIPFFVKGSNPCELVCTNEAHQYTRLAIRVKDGTPCNPGTKDMCISGTCRKVGCDWEIDSKAVEDVCGECNGDGMHCKLVEETYTLSEGNGYVQIATIPTRSTNIVIEELAASENILAISSRDKKFYLNGNNHKQRDGDLIAGKNVIGVYSQAEPNKEKVMIKGPTAENLILYYVFSEPGNPGVNFKYYVPIEEPERAPIYRWELVRWDPCSVACGGGIRISQPRCIENEAGEVSNSFCNLMPKPDILEEPCNIDPCKTRWIAGSWTKCTGCGGKKGSQSREIQCMKQTGNVDEEIMTDNGQCKGKPPKRKQSCVGEEPCERNAESDKKGNSKLDKRDNAKTAQKDNAKSDKKDSSKSDRKLNQIIVDTIPPGTHILKVPILEKGKKSHMSDEAYEEFGDQVSDEIDTKNAEDITEENSKNEDGRKEMANKNANVTNTYRV